MVGDHFTDGDPEVLDLVKNVSVADWELIVDSTRYEEDKFSSGTPVTL
jgi:hypothetical protein